jgi:hypothetical protein
LLSERDWPSVSSCPKLITESGSRLTEAFIDDANGREGPFRPVVALDAHTTPPLPDELTLGRHIDLAVCQYLEVLDRVVVTSRPARKPSTRSAKPGTKSTWCRLHSTAMPLSCAISRRSDSADTAAAGSRLATGSSARIMRLSCVRTRASGGGVFIGRVSGASLAPEAAGWRSASRRSACDMAAADVVAALVLPTPARATGGVLRDAHGSQQNRQQRGGGSCFLRLLS